MPYQRDGSRERRSRPRYEGEADEKRPESLKHSFYSYLNNLIVRTPETIDCDYIATTQRLILASLESEPRLRRLVVDLSRLMFIDRFDIERLLEVFKAVHLMGRSVALCGIQPAIAVLFVQFNLDLSDCTITQTLEDLPTIASRLE